MQSNCCKRLDVPKARTALQHDISGAHKLCSQVTTEGSEESWAGRQLGSSMLEASEPSPVHPIKQSARGWPVGIGDW